MHDAGGLGLDRRNAPVSDRPMLASGCVPGGCVRRLQVADPHSLRTVLDPSPRPSPLNHGPRRNNAMRGGEGGAHWCDRTTGSAPLALRRAALHPWLQPVAPAGAADRPRQRSCVFESLKSAALHRHPAHIHEALHALVAGFLQEAGQPRGGRGPARRLLQLLLAVVREPGRSSAAHPGDARGHHERTVDDGTAVRRSDVVVRTAAHARPGRDRNTSWRGISSGIATAPV